MDAKERFKENYELKKQRILSEMTNLLKTCTTLEEMKQVEWKSTKTIILKYFSNKSSSWNQKQVGKRWYLVNRREIPMIEKEISGIYRLLFNYIHPQFKVPRNRVQKLSSVFNKQEKVIKNWITLHTRNDRKMLDSNYRNQINLLEIWGGEVWQWTTRRNNLFAYLGCKTRNLVRP